MQKIRIFNIFFLFFISISSFFLLNTFEKEQINSSGSINRTDSYCFKKARQAAQYCDECFNKNCSGDRCCCCTDKEFTECLINCFVCLCKCECCCKKDQVDPQEIERLKNNKTERELSKLKDKYQKK